MNSSLTRPLLFLLLLAACTEQGPDAPFTAGEYWAPRYRAGAFTAGALYAGKIYCSGLNIKGPNYFYCFDMQTGTVRWRAAVASWADRPPLVTDSGIYYSSYVGDLYRFSPDGHPLWEVRSPAVFSDHAINPLNGNLLLRTVANGCYELDRADGRLLHHWGKASIGMPLPLFDSGRMLLARINPDSSSTARGGRLRFLDYATGKTIWERETGDGEGQPLLQGGRLYFYSNGRMHCLAAGSGQQAWQSDSLGESRATWLRLYAEGDKLLADVDSHTVYLLDARSGALIETVAHAQLERRPSHLPRRQWYSFGRGDSAYTATIIQPYFFVHDHPEYLVEVKRRGAGGPPEGN